MYSGTLQLSLSSCQTRDIEPIQLSLFYSYLIYRCPLFIVIANQLIVRNEWSNSAINTPRDTLPLNVIYQVYELTNICVTKLY